MARNGPHIQKYTPERTARILDAVSMGAKRGMAAAYGGIDLDTLLYWEKKYPEFKAATLEAEARAVVGWLAKIEKAASDGTWQAAAWKLERLYPEDYGRTVQDTRHAGVPGGEPVKVTHDVEPASVAAFRATLAALGIGPELADAGPILPPEAD